MDGVGREPEAGRALLTSHHTDNGTAPGRRPGPLRSVPAQSTGIVNELVVPVGVLMPKRVTPLTPAGIVNCTVAVPISSKLTV